MWRRLDPGSGRPLYRQIADDIREGIRTGELRPGQLLPTEANLAIGYEVSVDVVRHALAGLRGEGLIVTGRGKGSRVRDLPEASVVNVPPGVRITTRMPTEDERLHFGLSEGTPLLVVESPAGVELLPGDQYAIETVASSDEASDT